MPRTPGVRARIGSLGLGAGAGPDAAGARFEALPEPSAAEQIAGAGAARTATVRTA
ncbi:hypothetical protein ACFWAR_11795 [Streptomyces sp. NPDC059917]|uniref:hypothetical protein n=1 Tax=Streptomyces sp. NPDC059917 TaxID=3347002 RepID=UPI00364827F7